MNSKEIFNLAAQLDNNKVNQQIIKWSDNNDFESIKTYSYLVRTGDTKELACATVVCQNKNKSKDDEMYRIAYYS